MRVRREASGLLSESNLAFWIRHGKLTMLRLSFPCLAICCILSSDFLQLQAISDTAESNNISKDKVPREPISLSKTIVVLDKIQPNRPVVMSRRGSEPQRSVIASRLVIFGDEHNGEVDFGGDSRAGQFVETIDLTGHLETAAQSEELINPTKNPQRVDISLFQAIKNQNINKTGANSQADQVNELNRDFLTLFDELWKIKNSSVNALVRLEYFNKTRLQQQLQDQEQQQQQDRDKNKTNLDLVGNNQDRRIGSTSNGNALKLDRINLKNNLKLIYEKQGQQLKSNQIVVANKLGMAANRVSGWLSSAQQRIQTAVDSLCAKLMDKFALIKPSSSRLAQANSQNGMDSSVGGYHNNNDPLNPPTNIFEVNDRIKDLISEELNPTAPSKTRSLVKRSNALELDALDQSPQGSKAPCNNLTIDEVNKCRSTETLINSNLNNSFPGTSAAIEENCRHITFLLSNCWPDQLQQLRSSLSSWNESILLHTDFALPSGFIEQKLASSYEGGSCGVVPQLLQYIRDRINWMWLNLCIDKKFRQDYVDNLRCLGTWNLEKAQMTCSHEYKRMQTYLASQAESGNALGVGFEWATNSKRTRTNIAPTPAGSSPNTIVPGADKVSANGDRTGEATVPVSVSADTEPKTATMVPQSSNVSKILLTESELTDREVSSKMLCCMFDQFLRCVHKQAVRDCGRPGAQHVVNFMSRIGTDDMKFLCNSETKTVNRSKPNNGGGGNRRAGGFHDRSPFIEANYCTDPRIQSGLFNEQSDRDNSASGGVSGNGSGSSAGGGGNNNGGPSRSTGRIRTKNPNHHINHDPTFFGSDKMPFSAAHCTSCPPTRQTTTLSSGVSLLSMIVIMFML